MLLPAACSDPTHPERIDVPPFVFVSDEAGAPALYRYDAGTVTRLSTAGSDDRDPHSAAGRIVFTARRDGNPEIYSADLALTAQQRLTTTSATDDAPALDPSGTTIAFVSTRSGTPRVWLMDADGANPRPLETGSPTFVPEGSPTWSPSGSRIAFTSTRTNASQVFVVPATGGSAVQLSREATGAFIPAWTGDGQSIVYVVLAGGPRIVRIPAAGGDATAFALDDRGISEPVCQGTICLAVLGALGETGDLMALSATGRTRRVILARTADDRQPAILVP
jgi:Tol biopolymer transport system component